jgi:hypothetical protein
MRDEALLRLYEFNPDATRKIAISRIRKGDVTREMYSNSRALLLLPDKTLPELDDALLNALERGKPVEFLVARYASEAVLERVRAFSGSRQGLCVGCFSPISSASILPSRRSGSRLRASHARWDTFLPYRRPRTCS